LTKSEGNPDGIAVGQLETEGFAETLGAALMDGSDDIEGLNVSKVGLNVGEREGLKVGLSEGLKVGDNVSRSGDCVGDNVGLIVGNSVSISGDCVG